MILITGGAGFIGSNLQAALASRGLETIVVDSLGCKGKWLNLAKHAPDRITLNLDDAGYRQIEDLGNLVLVTARAARAAPRLVGYHLTFLRNDLHSVHTLIGYVDSYYLLPEYRRGWNGFRLIRESERVLRELGVQKVYVGATEHMQTENLFRFGKYQIEEKIFSKLL